MVRFLGLFVISIVVLAPLEAQEEGAKHIVAAVNYLSSGTIYLDAGRGKGLAAGDTVMLRRNGAVFVKAVITAVSASSSAAVLVSSPGDAPAPRIVVGDSASVWKVMPQLPPVPLVRTRDTSSSQITRWSSPGNAGPVISAPSENIVTGRLALQYAQAGFVGAPPDYSQPSLVSRLNIDRLFGTPWTFSLFARTNHNSSLRKYEEGSRTRLRMYDLSFSYDDPHGSVGGSVGRVTSVYMGGLGQIDGGQFFVRAGRITAGVLLGTQPDYTTSGVDTRQQKGAAFVHYGWDGGTLNRWDVTVAYGRQMNTGKLDRDFMYVQNTARLGMDLYLYQSSEVDLHVMEGGFRKSGFRLTNTYATISYSPGTWLSASAGYDATRNIYLLESMKWLPDTLFDRTLRQGYRTSVSIRLPFNLMLTGIGRFQPASGIERASRSVGGGGRIFDLAGTGIDIGAQYTDLKTVYTNGKDFTADADDWVTHAVCVMLRYDRYAYTVLSNLSEYVTSTGSAMVQCRISRAWYSLISYDRVWDTTANSDRILCEIGLRF